MLCPPLQDNPINTWGQFSHKPNTLMAMPKGCNKFLAVRGYVSCKVGGGGSQKILGVSVTQVQACKEGWFTTLLKTRF